MDKDTFQKAREELLPLIEDQARTMRIASSAEHFERLVHQAEVAMSKLTGSAEWDSFVQIVQNRLDAAKDDYEHMAYELAHTDFHCSIEAMTRRRLQLAAVHSVISVLEWITELPREIMDAAAAAGVEENGEAREYRVAASPPLDNEGSEA